MLHHVACAGQTIGELAKAYRCPEEELAELNGFTADAPLASGVVIWIPDTEHAVGLGFVPEAPGTFMPEMAAPPVLRLPATIYTALRRHAERSGLGRLVLSVRSAGEGDVTHLHLPGNSES